MTAPKFKATETKSAMVAINFLMKLREKAKAEQIRSTHAVQLLVAKHPELSRPVVSKAAVYAGINTLTARNVWDSVHHG